MRLLPLSDIALAKILAAHDAGKTPSPSTVRDAVKELDNAIESMWQITKTLLMVATDENVRKADENWVSLQKFLTLKVTLETQQSMEKALKIGFAQLQEEMLESAQEQESPGLAEFESTKCCLEGCNKDAHVWDGDKAYCKSHAREHGVVVTGKI